MMVTHSRPLTDRAALRVLLMALLVGILHVGGSGQALAAELRAPAWGSSQFGGSRPGGAGESDVEPAVPLIAGGAWCRASNTPRDFRALEIYLNVYFGNRNSNQVWQTDSNDEIWQVYCFASGGKAVIAYSGSRLISLSPSHVILSDGTRVDLRIASASGGWTVDINRPGVSKLYKVHVRRAYVTVVAV